MDFSFSEEQKAARDAAREFAVRELLPGVIERDEKQLFPEKQIEQLGELGFMGMMVDPNFGGSGMDTISYVLALEEISKIDAATAVILSVNNSLVCHGLETFGTTAQKEKYLRPLAEGKLLGAFSLSEPEAGSDATHITTSAVDMGDHYLLNGSKNWVTNGSSAAIYIVIAQSDPSKRHKGINAFIVEKSMQGFEIGPKENKLGIRSSDTHSLQFTDVKIPKDNRIGEDGDGFKIAMNVLNCGRIGIAAQALGIASGAFDRALHYSKERKTFGKPISNHQAIQLKLVKMATEIEAGRHLCLRAAWLKDQNMAFVKESSMAKLYCSEIALNAANEAIQIHGGYGYVREYHVERMMRDAKITQIYEGTSEIQKMVIARELLK